MNEKEKLERQLNVTIPNDLYLAAKVKAAQVDRPIREIVEELLRTWVKESTPSPKQ